jgi:hypothetical protein
MEKIMSISRLFTISIALALLCFASSASARLFITPYLTVTAAPNDYLVDCPIGCLKPDNTPVEAVLAGYVPNFVQTWTYQVGVYLGDASASDLDSLLLSYSSSGNCLKLDSSSYLYDSDTGLKITFDSTAPAINASALMFTNGVSTLTMVTNNAFKGGIGHDMHSLYADLSYTVEGMSGNETGNASGYDCTPEPATMSLLAIGAIAFIRKR